MERDKMKNTKPKNGFYNRHTDGLPLVQCEINVLISRSNTGDQIYLCEWQPFDPKKYEKNDLPATGYVGCAYVISGKHAGIGFNAWAQNNSEFVYFSIV